MGADLDVDFLKVTDGLVQSQNSLERRRTVRAEKSIKTLLPAGPTGWKDEPLAPVPFRGEVEEGAEPEKEAAASDRSFPLDDNESVVMTVGNSSPGI